MDLPTLHLKLMDEAHLRESVEYKLILVSYGHYFLNVELVPENHRESNASRVLRAPQFKEVRFLNGV